MEDVPMLCGEVVEDDSYTKLKETLSNLPNYPESGNYSVQSVQSTQNQVNYSVQSTQLPGIR